MLIIPLIKIIIIVVVVVIKMMMMMMIIIIIVVGHGLMGLKKHARIMGLRKKKKISGSFLGTARAQHVWAHVVGQTIP